MDVSIIIVHYKTLQLTTACIQSIYQYTKGVSFEIIVVDNDSQDGARDSITAKFPAITWLDSGYNAGFSRANNIGIRHAKGRYYLLLNSDTEFVDDILTKCVSRMDTQLDIAACGGIQMFADRTPRPFFRSLATFKRYMFVLPPGKFFERLLEKLIPEKKYEDPEEVDWIPAAFLLVRREVVDKVGMLDEDFFMYGDDVEWNCRLARAGRLKAFDDCRYIHHEWGSNPKRKEVLITIVNKFYPQIQLSNLVWVRKEYGVLPYLVLMLNYYLMIPIYFGWKIALNISRLRNPFGELEQQKDYTRKVWLFSTYFWRIIRNKPYFYKLDNQV
ncbi:MAG: glycosyltransferase family 2 protein [Runella sp.]